MSILPHSEKSSNFEMVLRSAMELPGVRINRVDFLRKELSKHFDSDVVEKAILTNPAQAGIYVKNLEKIAKACINYETKRVTALSAAAGIPGGLAMLGTLPADIAQIFAHIIRVMQKLIYLYGWQEMFRDGNDELDDATSNQLTLFIGVMFGVNAANTAITKIALLAAAQVERALLTKALTKGTIYPIVKSIAKAIGVKMTKKIFAKGVGKAVPLVGAAASGGVTFAIFRPMTKRLQNHLISLPMADVGFYKESYDSEDIIDIDFSDIILEDMDEMNDADDFEE